MSLKNTCICMQKLTGGKTPETRWGTIPCSPTEVNILHDGVFAHASKVSSGYCTVPLPHRQCLSLVLTSVQE